jgi:hypothetical protein
MQVSSHSAGGIRESLNSVPFQTPERSELLVNLVI